MIASTVLGVGKMTLCFLCKERYSIYAFMCVSFRLFEWKKLHLCKVVLSSSCSKSIMCLQANGLEKCASNQKKFQRRKGASNYSRVPHCDPDFTFCVINVKK